MLCRLGPGHGAGDLDVGRDADAHRLAVTRGVAAGLLGVEAGVVGRGECAFERLDVVAAVVDGAHRGGRGERVGGDVVAAPQLGGVDAQPAREHVEGALDRYAASGRPAPWNAPTGVVFESHDFEV